MFYIDGIRVGSNLTWHNKSKDIQQIEIPFLQLLLSLNYRNWNSVLCIIVVKKKKAIKPPYLHISVNYIIIMTVT